MLVNGTLDDGVEVVVSETNRSVSGHVGNKFVSVRVLSFY